MNLIDILQKVADNKTIIVTTKENMMKEFTPLGLCLLVQLPMLGPL